LPTSKDIYVNGQKVTPLKKAKLPDDIAWQEQIAEKRVAIDEAKRAAREARRKQLKGGVDG
jgi:hypothetical protein